MKKKKIILYIIIGTLAIASILTGLRYWQTVSSMLKSKEVLNLKSDTQIIHAMSMNNEVITAASDGNLYFIDNLGKIITTKNLKSKIFYLSKSPDNKYILVGAVDFNVFDKDGNLIFKETLKDHVPFKGKFLDGEKVKLIFQSLNDLSYSALTVDLKGKVLQTENVNDLGENNFIDISPSGRILYSGERGEVYLIENGGFIKDADIDIKVSTIHSIFGYFVGSNAIVAGYKYTTDPNQQIPVLFYDSTLKLIKRVSFTGNINNITVDKDTITFATDQGTFTYSSTGDEIASQNEFGFEGFNFVQNDNFKMYSFFKTAKGQTISYIFKIDLFDNRDKELGTYLIPCDSLPQILISDKASLVIFINKNKLYFIYKD
jgi:hypothetical protein